MTDITFTRREMRNASALNCMQSISTDLLTNDNITRTSLSKADAIVSSDSRHLCVQGTTKRLRPGLVNFVPALAYHFCLNLLNAFTKPGRSLLVVPCMNVRAQIDRNSDAPRPVTLARWSPPWQGGRVPPTRSATRAATATLPSRVTERKS